MKVLKVLKVFKIYHVNETITRNDAIKKKKRIIQSQELRYFNPFKVKVLIVWEIMLSF